MFQHTIFFLPLCVPSTLTPIESKAVSLGVISTYESPESVSISSGRLFYYSFLAWGCYFGQVLYSFYHSLVMIWDIWFHSDRPWGLWHFLGLFLFILIVWVIWVCINKHWALWHFLGLSLWVLLPQDSLSRFVVPCCLPKDHLLLHSSSVWPYHCMQIALQDLLWSPSTFLRQYCDSFFDPLLSSFRAAPSEKGDIHS